jgi:hypothetical protein
MKRFLLLCLFSILLVSSACQTEVSKNNQVANGELQTVATDEDSSAAGEGDTSTDPAAKPEATFAEDKTTPPKEANSPEALVDELYKDNEREISPFFQNKKRELVDQYFVKALADMIWKDAAETKEDEGGALDFDPLFNAQDTEISDLEVGKSEVKGDKSTVVVTFINFGEKETIKYLLIKESGKWKIEDIDYGDDTLTKVYKEEKTKAPAKE